MRKHLAKLDRMLTRSNKDKMLRNKIAIECLNFLKYETESTIDEKQGKRSRKKHLSKEAKEKNSVQASYLDGL